MEADLEEFFIECEMDKDCISSLKEQKIDISTIRMMTPTELGKFVPRVGDVYKIKEFASNYNLARKPPLSNTLMTLAQKLKLKMSGVDMASGSGGSNSSSVKDKATPPHKSTKLTRKISINWKCDNRMVRLDQGGGARQIDAPKSYKKKDILEKALALYFPGGESLKKISLASFDVQLLDFAGNSFDENLTVEQMFVLTGLTRLNFCLHTTSLSIAGNKRAKKQKKKVYNIISSSEDDSTDDQQQEKSLKKETDPGSALTSSTLLNESAKNLDQDEIFLHYDSLELDEYLKFNCSSLNDNGNIIISEVQQSTSQSCETSVGLPHRITMPTLTTAEFPLESTSPVCSNSTEEDHCLEVELRGIQHTIDADEPLLVNACREDPLTSITNTIKRSTFTQFKKIDVQFVDVDNVAEGAIDDGGPSRELFRLCLKQLRDSEIFTGIDDSKIIALNITSLQKRKYYFAGVIMAMSIVHGGPRPNFLSQTIFDFIAKGCCQPVIEDLHNTVIKQAIEDIGKADSFESFKHIIAQHEDLLDLGVSTGSFQNRESLIKEILHHLVIDRCCRALEQFTEGLKTLGILSLIRKYPEKARFLFCRKENTKLSAKYINTLFLIKRSNEGTQQRVLESRTICFWRDFLQNCEDGDCPVSLSDVLAFATGSDTEPALGFDSQPTIEFLFEDAPKFPKSNTCALILYLPIAVNSDFENYRENLVFGILNGLPTFGLS